MFVVLSSIGLVCSVISAIGAVCESREWAGWTAAALWSGSCLISDIREARRNRC